MLYALCLATPTAVMAFGHSGIPAHCLTLEQPGIGTSHVHQSDHGSGHRHAHPGGDHGQPSKCCGLFSVSAIAPQVNIFVGRHPPVSLSTPLVPEYLTGRGSDRIDRPPRSLLSV